MTAELNQRNNRTPVLDGSGWQGSGRALAPGDRVTVGPHRTRQAFIDSVDYAAGTVTVAHSSWSPSGADTVTMPGRDVRLIPPVIDEMACPLCREHIWADDPHAPGCPDGDGLHDMSLDLAWQIAETRASDGGRYPQYVGHFDTWTFATMIKDVSTKGGFSFAAGERVLVRPHDYPWWVSGPATDAVFSMRRGIVVSMWSYRIQREETTA